MLIDENMTKIFWNENSLIEHKIVANETSTLCIITETVRPVKNVLMMQTQSGVGICRLKNHRRPFELSLKRSLLNVACDM